MYQLRDYDFELPEELIAQHPLSERDHSRLLLLRRADGARTHSQFKRLPEFLVPGDVLVLNNTRVVAGRLLGRKESGGKVEALILDYADGVKNNRFNCLIKASKRPKEGSRLIFDHGLEARVIGMQDNIGVLAIHGPGDTEALLQSAGHIPLPPYIRRPDEPADRHSYQTVYAVEKGAIAAPTAGLHFTRGLLAELSQRGVEIVYLTLHVGYGTFVPVRVDDIRDHRMHAEAFSVPSQTVQSINNARAQGRRVIAVGTTSVRTLEYCTDEKGRLVERSGWCDLFIYPGYRFRLIDGMITNFHLPQSTLLMLVAAFVGRRTVLETYAEAVRLRYRFFSYGDAMLIL